MIQTENRIATEILVLIPALNEEESIGLVIANLKKHGLSKIRVVDNGSTDATVQRAQAAGAEVIVESRRGYGQACWRGLQNLPNEIEWILFCDADGSDDLNQLPSFLTESEHADFVMGNRRGTASGKDSLTGTQNFGNALATTLIRWGWGHR